MTPRLLRATLFFAVTFAALIALGVWQLDRLAWKRGLLAQIAAAEAAAPVPLTEAAPQFTRLSVSGHLDAGKTARYLVEVRSTRQGEQMGARLIQPLTRPDGSVILVDRGWAPDNATLLAPPPETIVGYARRGDVPGWFTPNDDIAHLHFYTLDPARIGAALGLAHVAPFVLVALGSAKPGEYPVPAEHLPRPPNDHLNYALTWFALAGSLVGVYFVWIQRARRA
jgi:surfeit locus 1 family protein